MAGALRDAYGRGVAVVSQDNVRRTILRDRDRPGTANIGLMYQVVRYSLEHGFHVVVEGILECRPVRPDAGRPAGVPQRPVLLLLSRHLPGRDHPAARTRPQAAEFTADDMRSWYLRLDLLHCVPERVIGEASALRETVDVILAESGLLDAVVLKAEAAARSDIPSWLEARRRGRTAVRSRAAAGEPSAPGHRSGPGPGGPRPARGGARCGPAQRRSAVPADQMAGRPAKCRRRGVARLLMAEIIRRRPCARRASRS